MASLFGLSLFLLAGSCQGGDDATGEEEPKAGANMETVAYASSSENFVNPERGFMHTYIVKSEGEALSQTFLNNIKNEKVSLFLRLYYLEKFKDGPLSQTQLDLIKTDFERTRNAGLKCVLRFAYTDQMDGTDAPIERVEDHLDQLKDVLVANADVIAFVQAGFIGAYGEWHASSNNLTTLENKKRVVNKLLSVFPETVKIQLRTPKFKQEIFGYNTAINGSVGYGNSELARVGFHNDCFLASIDDYGTYTNVAAEKKYISDEALFVPTGGETCPPSGIPAATCSVAEVEMSLLKWTYLNLDYYGPVLNGWRNNNCFDDFERKLGYRIALKTAKLPKSLATTETFKLEMELDNTGFAPVYAYKNSYMVFTPKSGGTAIERQLDFDVRKIVPSATTTLVENISLTGIPAGSYDLAIVIKDQSTKLANTINYNIRLANTGTWDATTGRNNLNHTLEIK